MLDIVFLGMFVIVVAMAVSVFLVRVRRKYLLHRNIQIALASILAVVIVAFEIDVRYVTDWRRLAAASPYFDSGIVYYSLIVHLVFAIPCPFVWAIVIWRAIKKFPAELQPGEHSREHILWGRIAAILFLLTAATGCTFYWLAFIAS